MQTCKVTEVQERIYFFSSLDTNCTIFLYVKYQKQNVQKKANFVL